MNTYRKQKGFTLVEILIVVVILGILAAIVIPQFSEASTEARESSVKSNLQMLRSQIELYKVQHNGSWPDATTGTTFATALTSATDADGTVSATGAYGPYMVSVPNNVLCGTEANANVITIKTDTGAPSASTSQGWVWNSYDHKIYCPSSSDSLGW